MLKKAYIHLLVPLSYDRNDFPKACAMRGMKSITKKELEGLDESLKGKESEAYFRYCFDGMPFSESSQMKGSPLLEEGENAFCERFYLSQVQRTQIGIYQDEGYQYCLKGKEIPFQIGKVGIIFTRFGIAYFYMEILIEQENKDVLLDFDEKILLKFHKTFQDIDQVPEILYEVPIEEGKKEVKKIKLKKIIKNILTMQEYIKLQEYKDKQFSKPYSLLYLLGDISSEKIPAFLENCRNRQSGSEYPDEEIAKRAFETYCLKTRKYLYWTVATNVVVGFANLTEAGVENEKFLTDNGGLPQSVANNYLLMYLFQISDLLCMKRLLDVKETDIPFSRKEILELRRQDLSNVDFINTLFEKYLAEKMWNLTENLEKIKEKQEKEEQAIIRIEEKKRNAEQEEERQNKFVEHSEKQTQEIIKTIREVEENNKSDNKVIRENMERLNQNVEQISQNIDILLNFVQNDLQEYLEQEKKKIKNYKKAESDEKQISAFIQNTSEYISSHIGKSEDIMIEETNYLKSIFGEENWKKLHFSARNSLVSASVLWKRCKDITDKSFDYSGVCITATSALEIELKEIFFTGFLAYLEKTYGRPNKHQLNKTYANWPDYLLSAPRYKVENNKKRLEKSDKFTMGKLPYLLGEKDDYTFYQDKEYVKKQTELMKKRMSEYLKTIVKDKKVENPLEFFIRPQNDSFVDKCEKIREDYRNKAAHSENMKLAQARECYEQVVGKVEALNYQTKVTGILLELLDKIDV